MNNHNADNPITKQAVDHASTNLSPAQQPTGWTESSADWIAPPRTTNTLPQSPDPIALQAHDLSVRYGSHQVLSNITFTLYQGDTLGLLGLNGAGKSTLLKVLSGALAPDQGTVKVGDHELFENVIASRMNIGYAPDKPAIYPEFRVTEYLKFIARMRRIDRRHVKTSVEQVLERCALGEVRNRVIGNLSTGYQQRVNIAQALIHSPNILILDEPANGLDPVQLMEIRELVSTLAPEQATVFSSHLLSEVDSICNRVMLIDHGLQILDAPLASLSNTRNNSFEVRMPQDNDFDLNELPGVAHACKTSTGRWLVTGDALTPEHIEAMLRSRGQLARDQLASQITVADNYLESLFRQLAAPSKPDNSAPHNQSTEL